MEKKEMVLENTFVPCGGGNTSFFTFTGCKWWEEGTYPYSVHIQ